MTVVHFRLEAKAAGLAVAPPAGERARFERDDVAISLEIETAEQGETDDCLIIATTARAVSAKVFRLLEDLRSLRLDEGEPGELEIAGRAVRFEWKELSDREFAWLLDPPEPVVSICADIADELQAEAARLITLARWILNRPAPAHPLSHVRLFWSFDGAGWSRAPTRPLDLPTFGGPEIELDESGVDLLRRIWERGAVREPIARQILLEAVALSSENQRAALVLAIAAAEVGVKRFAAESTNESEAWLISVLPTPPLHRLIRDYLPFYTDKRAADGQAVPKHVRRVLHSAVEARNEVVHRGAGDYPPEQLAELLVAVNDLLYLLDWFGGKEWAFTHLQKETQQAYT